MASSNGVFPNRFFISTSAPSLMSYSTKDLWLFKAAQSSWINKIFLRKGVFPSLFYWFMKDFNLSWLDFLIVYKSNSKTSTCPLAAHMSKNKFYSITASIINIVI